VPLLSGFLSGALGTELIVRLVNLNDVPRGCRTQLRLTEEVGYAWSAWSTPQGVVAARGGLDVEGSRRIGLPLTDRVVRHGAEATTPCGATATRSGDIYQSVVRAINLCDELGYASFHYDADGLGAGVRGDARTINEARAAANQREIRDEPFRGSGAVWQPEGEMVSKRKNKDYFANLKAQSWWALGLRFQATYRAVHERMPYDPDAIISINPRLTELLLLTMELSQPTYSINSVGKILVDKMPPGMRSPNLGDSVMIAFEPSSRAIELWERLGRAG
jgi:phage terminase large subunit